MKYILAVLLFAVAASAQVKHAPVDKTVQCHADAKAWIQNHDTVSTDTIEDELGELLACWNQTYQNGLVIDKTNNELYHHAMVTLATEQRNRYASFILRHNLAEQFRKEDAEGKR